MENDYILSFSISKDIAEKFDLCLNLNKENQDEVVRSLIVQYISDRLFKASNELELVEKNNVGIKRLKETKSESKTIKISEDMVKIAYSCAKKVYFGQLTRNEGKNEISRITGMNGGSAQDYITDFLAMMEGKEYHRTMSNFGTEYFIKSIRKDFGEKAFLLAIEATERHINYYNALGNGQLKAKEKLIKMFKESLY